MKQVIITKINDDGLFGLPAYDTARIQFVWWFGRWIVLTLTDGKRKIFNRKYYDILSIIE